MKAHPQLSQFLTPYDKKIQALCKELRDFVTDTVPEANELIWDNYNAVAMAYSKSLKLKDGFCHIAVYEKYVNFGFNRGVDLEPISVQFRGKGKLIRHVRILDVQSIPKAELQRLIWDAVVIADQMNPSLTTKSSHGESIVMSISEKKIRPKG